MDRSHVLCTARRSAALVETISVLLARRRACMNASSECLC